MPALILYGVTLFSVDLHEVMAVNPGAPLSPYLIWSLILCAAVATYSLAWLFAFIRTEDLKRHVPEYLSSLCRPLEMLWPYFVFLMRVWLLSGFEAAGALLIIQTFAGPIDERHSRLFLVGGVILFSCLHLLYESRVTWARWERLSVEEEKRA